VGDEETIELRRYRGQRKAADHDQIEARDSLRALWIWGCRALLVGSADLTESYKPLL
jgi:hypothetical protein